MVFARACEARLDAGVAPQTRHAGAQLDAELVDVLGRVGVGEQRLGVVDARRVGQADLEQAHGAYDRHQRLDRVAEHDRTVLEALLLRVALLVYDSEPIKHTHTHTHTKFRIEKEIRRERESERERVTSFV